jgi:F0F1-type ATP synthase membrane subunit c/vacuolar-type H+-ATPase subunit K
MKKIMMIFLVFNFVLIATTFSLAAAQDANALAGKPDNSGQNSINQDMSYLPLLAKYFAAAICIAGATFSSGMAVGRIGAAAMGAVSEKPETGGTAMILAALAEGVCLWGIAGAFLILFIK